MSYNFLSFIVACSLDLFFISITFWNINMYFLTVLYMYCNGLTDHSDKC